MPIRHKPDCSHHEDLITIGFLSIMGHFGVNNHLLFKCENVIFSCVCYQESFVGPDFLNVTF